MLDSDINTLQKIDATLQIIPNPIKDGACMQERDLIANELLENEEMIPKGMEIFSCDYESHHDPHHWIEIVLGNGEKYIWDRTNQKIQQHFLPMLEAQIVWSHYASPSNRFRIIPVVNE